MKKILLVYPPFCTPASPPYSITGLYSFLKNNYDGEVEVLDLNIEFHKLKFPEYQKYYSKKEWDDYDAKTLEYSALSSKVYSENNALVVDGKKPELFDEMMKLITARNADVVAFSVVYSSQAFYTHALIEELEKESKNTVVGGPAVNSKLREVAGKTLNNELELLEYLTGEKVEHDNLNFDRVLDYSIYDLNSYFTPVPVIPLKTSTTCYYKQCAFCSHYNSSHYFEYSLDEIKKTVELSGQKYFFLMDDMVPKKRLLEIANMFNSLDVKWTCQLKPTAELDFDTLKLLKDSGLTMLMWGVESGSDRVLKLMSKGTNKKDISEVLKSSHKVGIKNIVYMMIGFPTETHEEFLETIDFLKENSDSIDLISLSIFGLQQGTKIYENPSKFGIIDIMEEKRTILEPKITYTVSSVSIKKKQ